MTDPSTPSRPDQKFLERLSQGTVYDSTDDKVGGIEQLFLDDVTGEPSWVLVKAGLFGMRASLVPLHDADLGDGDHVRVPYSKDVIKDAPKVDTDNHISRTEEGELHDYYRSHGWTGGAAKSEGDAGDTEVADRPRGRHAADETERDETLLQKDTEPVSAASASWAAASSDQPETAADIAAVDGEEVESSTEVYEHGVSQTEFASEEWATESPAAAGTTTFPASANPPAAQGISGDSSRSGSERGDARASEPLGDTRPEPVGDDSDSSAGLGSGTVGDSSQTSPAGGLGSGSVSDSSQTSPAGNLGSEARSDLPPGAADDETRPEALADGGDYAGSDSPSTFEGDESEGAFDSPAASVDDAPMGTRPEAFGASSDEGRLPRRISSFEEVHDGGYGIGSAAPISDGAQPLGHPIRAWRDTMSFQAGPDRDGEREPDVWFFDQRAAYNAGYHEA